MRVPLLWRLAPGVLFRFPRSAAAVAFSAGVVVLATILGPLFLASSERASLQAGMELTGPWEAGLQIVWRAYEYPDTPEEERRHLELAEEGRRLLAERVAGVPGLAAPTVTLLGGDGTARASGREAAARVVYRTRAYENVTVVEEGGEGVWIADLTARALRVEPGDTMTLTTPSGIYEARVGTIYRNLRDDEPREFWSPLTDWIYKQPESDAPPAPFVLVDLETVMDADRTAQIRWNIPLAGSDLAPEVLRRAAREFRDISRDVGRERAELGAALRDLGGFAFEPAVSTLLGGVLGTARDRLEASKAPTGVVAAAVRLLGAGLVVAAGLSLAARRRSEVRALIARGASPASLALRFAVEGVAPVFLGGAAGVALGYAGVRLAGASGAVEWSYVAGLADEAALAAVATLALLAVATGIAVAREERSFRARPARGRFVPLAAAAVVAAGGVVAYRALESISVAESDEPLAGSILLAPIGVIAAAALAGGVALRLLLPFVAASARERSTGVFLAAKRLAAGSGMTHTLVIVCGTALGVMFFGVTVASSVHRTATAKAKTFVGSDFSFGVTPNPPPLPPDLPFPATHVTKIQTYLEGSAQPVTVLGIEPDTFAAAAFWDDEFADEPLDELLPRLREADEGPFTALAAGFGEGAAPSLVGTDVPIEVVGRADAFPGMIEGQPLIAMTRESARRVLATGGSGIRSDLIWAKGDPEEVQETLLAAGQVAFEPLTVDEVLDSPTIQSLVWSLGLLGAVGALASATAVAGLSLYLQARHTAAQVAAAMTRRMGLPRRAELLSWVTEIGGAGVASFAVGAATGLVTASLVHDRLDVQPDLEPAPIFVVPVAVAALAGLAVAAVTALTARRLQKRMDRAAIGEIMRV
ncbi:MAG TPA: FtsX-like permease family protein [Actinomycetota bacterium]|nr:FtsX-like permease family protein [Actinomycetota bacterium]